MSVCVCREILSGLRSQGSSPRPCRAIEQITVDPAPRSCGSKNEFLGDEFDVDEAEVLAELRARGLTHG